MAKDVVCQMDVDPEAAAAETEYKGETYHFCAPDCKVAFQKDPERYLREGSVTEERERGRRVEEG